ncbi:MAG: type II secretion system protein [Bacteriovoracaceae bacterium]|nr:type II secretion system protein [Bacteriovoracaceae bacterium]
MVKRVNKQNGFTLLEVLIALSIFAFFASAYVTRESYNLSLSSHIKEEEKLKTLCEQVINQLIATPQEYSETLITRPETKKFEKEPEYEYTIEWKKLEMPDFNKLLPEDERRESGTEASSGIEKSLLAQVKSNLESMLWQVKVTVFNSKTKFSFSLSTWLYNDKAKVQFGGM